MMRTKTTAEAATRRGRTPLRRPAVAAATSPAALGRALVLLATSCAALGAGGRPCGRSRAPSRAPVAMAPLRYRDGDEDQPVDPRVGPRSFAGGTGAPAEAEAAATAAAPRLVVAPPRFPSLPVVGMRLALPSLPTRPADDEAQLVMDDYLEFVERRYSRLRPRHRPPRFRPHPAHDLRRVVVTLLLLDRHPLTVVPTPPPARSEGEGEKEDSLHALGLSKLASSRLRRRLHVDEARPHSRAAAPPAPAPLAAGAPPLPSLAVLPLAAALRRLVEAAAASLALLVALAGRAAAGVATRGGIRRSVLGGVGAALLVTCRPLFQGTWRSTGA